MKILKTNWINIIGILIAVYLYALMLNLFDADKSLNFIQVVFSPLILILLYGAIFWALFILLLIIFDLLFIVKNQENLKEKLILETFIIITPYVYWLIVYDELIFLVATVTFFITQTYRRKLIAKNI
jgi:hypothetical protein